MWGSGFGHLSALFELWTVFGLFLGTLVENSKRKKVAPVNFFNFPKKIKILTLIFGSQMRFSKMSIFGAPIESEGPGMVSS